MNKSGAPHLQLGPARVSVTPVPIPSGLLPRCSPDWPFVTSGVTRRWESAVFRFLHQLLPLSMSGAGFLFPFFSPASLLLFLPGSQGSPRSASGHLCVIIMYRAPGGSRDRVCTLSSVLYFYFHNVLALIYLRGHALEQEMSPLSLSAILLALSPFHPHSHVFSGFSCFASPEFPLFTLFPLWPLSGEGVFP